MENMHGNLPEECVVLFLLLILITLVQKAIPFKHQFPLSKKPKLKCKYWRQGNCVFLYDQLLDGKSCLSRKGCGKAQWDD